MYLRLTVCSIFIKFYAKKTLKEAIMSGFLCRRFQIALTLFVVVFFFNENICADDKLIRAWGHQSGTSSPDVSRTIVGDNEGNSYITGYTQGKIGDKTFGGFDVIVIKYDI